MVIQRENSKDVPKCTQADKWNGTFRQLPQTRVF